MSEEEKKINFERLTRFKYPPERLFRVYYDIILKHLIFPKISKKFLQNLSFYDAEKLASTIWNNSISEGQTENNNIHRDIIILDIHTFNTRCVLQDLFFTKLPEEFSFEKIARNPVFSDYKLQKEDFNGLFSYDKLYEIIRNRNIFHFQKTNKTLYRANLLIIAEGVTEELLLSEIGKLWGIDFDEAGIQIYGAGGKNQAVKAYNENKDRLNIPILVLFDSDAEENEELIKPILRKEDKIYRIKSGEFEDLLSDSLILNTINDRYKMNITQLKLEDIKKESHRKTEVLNDIFKDNGLGDFKKAEFSKLISQHIMSKEDFSAETDKIMTEIKKMYENKQL